VFYEYGRLHGAVRLRWRFLDERIPVPWVGRDEPTLHELQKSALAMKVPLEVRGQRNRHQQSRRAASAAVSQVTLTGCPDRAISAVLRYPVSATAPEKPLSRKGRERFPSWTSPVRPGRPLSLITYLRRRSPTFLGDLWAGVLDTVVIKGR
jgi:hypothetical protein